MMQDGGHLALYDNHDALRREIARHSKRDAEAYDRYSRDVMRQCKFIKPLLMREPPDPTSFKPRDLQELLYLGKRFHGLGEERMYDTLRFWTMSAADFLDEYFESEIVKAHFAGSSIIGTALGAAFARHGLRAAASLHGRYRRHRRRLGLCARRHGRDQQGARRFVRGQRRHHPQRRAGCARFWCSTGRAVRRGARRTARRSRRGWSSPIWTCAAPSSRPWMPRICRTSSCARCRNFKIRGSSGKLNIALDGLPRFPAIPAGSPCTPRRHARHRYHRNDGARLR